MLSDQLRQLLTAYVDGELTNRQRKAVERLLRRSPEARALLAQLQEDARRLHALPRHRLGEEFTARVLRGVRQRNAEERSRRAAREAALPLWTSVAAAAAVLIAVGFGSYFYFTHQPPDDRSAAARTQPTDPTPDPDNGSKDNGSRVVDNHTTPTDPPKTPQPREELPMPVAVNPEKPKDPVNPETVIGSETPQPDLEMFKPHVVKPPFMLVEDVRALHAERLRKELGEETALRVELPCNDTAKGFRRLQTALKEVGVTLAIDAAAQNRLDKPRLRSNYVLFVEDLTAEELARALARVGADDKKAAEARTKPDGQFSKVVVNRLIEADVKELSTVLRVEASQLQPGSGKSKGTERLALAVTYNPERPKANSPEVKRYLESRKPARPGALQVLLVLRETPR
jgi:anti-sigma-K factor RskA